jgi:hypothetical protein
LRGFLDSGSDPPFPAHPSLAHNYQCPPATKKAGDKIPALERCSDIASFKFLISDYDPVASMERKEKVGRKTDPKLKKYLITWCLELGRDELTMISGRPQVLTKALHYVEDIAKENDLEIYRIVPLERLTRHEKISKDCLAPAQSSGIAIVRASSLEEAGEMMKCWVEGLSYGGIPMGNYLDYEIEPIVEIGRRGGG